MSYQSPYYIAYDSPFRDAVPRTNVAGGKSEETDSSSIETVDCTVAKVSSSQYFFSIIPCALRMGETDSLRKKRHSDIRLRLKRENVQYVMLKEMKRRVLHHSFDSISEMCLKRLKTAIIGGLQKDISFAALDLFVFDASFMKEETTLRNRYEALRKSVNELRETRSDISKEELQDMLDKDERRGAIADFAEGEAANAKRLLLLLAKEQKKHTFERFVMLPKLYESFSKSLDQLSRAFELRGSHRGDTIKKVVIELLLNSICSLGLEKSQRSRAHLLGVRYHNRAATKEHRDHEIMGREKEGTNTMEEREILLAKLNYCFDSVQKGKKQIENFQRSHTLPFPGMFCWPESSLREALSYYIEDVPENCRCNVLVDSEMMAKIIEGGKDPKVLNAIFESELKRFNAEENLSDSAFAFKALLLLKEIYLRLFSETEFLPDFINAEMDKASEWEEKRNHGDYRSALVLGLIFLIRQNGVPEKRLESYLKTSSQNAFKLTSGIAEKSGSLFEQFKLYCALQVMQSLQTVPLRDAKSINELSKKVLKRF